MNDMTSAVLCDKGVVGGHGREVVVGKSLALDDKGAARVSLEERQQCYYMWRVVGPNLPFPGGSLSFVRNLFAGGVAANE